MHSKMKGALGEIAVAADLMRKGFPVFQELGDLSRVDLIVLVDGKPIKVQVKSSYMKDNKVSISSRKSGPGYRFKYRKGDVDIFALYILNTQKIVYVSSDRLLQNKVGMTFREGKSKNNQLYKINEVNKFPFEEALRDCTQSTQTDKAVGNETVQTTTPLGGSQK